MKCKILVILLILPLVTLALFAATHAESLAEPQTKYQRVQKRDYPELPLFQINVEQIVKTYYLHEINLKATLVPRAGLTAARESIKNKMVYFLIDGLGIGLPDNVCLPSRLYPFKIRSHMHQKIITVKQTSIIPFRRLK